MSRGLSNMQRHILAVLRGDERGYVFANAAGGLHTSELYEELTGGGMFEDTPRRQAVFAIRRACRSLLERGLLERRYSVKDEPPFPREIAWSAVKPPPAPAAAARAGS
jgi:hypothetical protein